MTQEREFDSLRRQFNLFEDEKGVWRCKGRLGPISEMRGIVESTATENEPVSAMLSNNPVQNPPDNKPADSRNESATSGAPRRSKCAAAQKVDANRMTCMFELDD